ncbi:MAG: phosphoribosylamine--glycine ligase [Anaerolineaceae bacterium]
MKIGLIGSGGREHAIAKALCKSPARDSLYVYGSHLNPGIQKLAASSINGEMQDIQKIGNFFTTNKVELVVIGPEVPLIAGVSDSLRSKGLKVVGPSQAQACLEGDKVFMRDLLRRRVKKGSPRWKEVRDIETARAFINEVGQVAVKPIGLTGGKGVSVMGVHYHSIEEALEKVQAELDQDGIVLLEERLIGEEFSRIAFVSDGNLAAMPVAQDFKYAFDGDQGGMTGGMGAYTMADGSMPFLTKEDLQDADSILQLTVDAIEAESGEGYRGFLYGQFIATAHGVRVIEFNVRLGDPEAINMMALLETDAPDFLANLAEGHLQKDKTAFAPKASVCKYLVPAAYPQSGHEKVAVVLNEEEINKEGFSVIFASIIQKSQTMETLGSRAFAIVGMGEDTYRISEKMETLLDRIEPSSLRHRKDIGDAQIIRNKIQKMESLRSKVY